MFNHIKRVDAWTIMEAHVYDHFCHCLLFISLCEMKVKNFESKIVFWTCLNEQVMCVGLPKPNFHGIMVVVASANLIQFIKFMVVTQMFP